MAHIQGGILIKLSKIYHEIRRKFIPASKEDVSWRFDQVLAILVDLSERLSALEIKLNASHQPRNDLAACVEQETYGLLDKSFSSNLEGHAFQELEQIQRNSEEFVTKAYLGVLRREPDKEGLFACTKALVNGDISYSQVISSLMNSYEFDYAPEKDPQIKFFLNRELVKFTNSIRAFTPFSVVEIEALGEQFTGVEYFEVHKSRFVEMINFVAFAKEQNSAQLRVLECGSTISTKLIKSALPDISLSISDFKTFDEINKASLFPMKEIVDKHYQIDFQKDNLCNLFYEGAPKFDVILLCEVIEHVLVNPVKVFRFLLKHLVDGGFVYITTPNVFQRSYLESYKARINPVRMFPEAYTFEDAPHFHVREYSMSEMLQCITKAGGEVAGFYFSDCWDNPEFIHRLPEHERSNLIVVMRRSRMH